MDELTARRLLGNLIGGQEAAGLGAVNNAAPAFARIDQSIIRNLKPVSRQRGGLAGLAGGKPSAAPISNKVENGIFSQAALAQNGGGRNARGARAANDDDAADAENNGDNRQDEIDQIAIAAWRARRVDGTLINYNLPEPWEQLWALYPSGDFHYAGRIRSGQPVNVPSGKIAVLHTHPKWAELKPGEEDNGFNVPLYGLSRHGVWVIHPGGGATVLAGRGEL